MGREGLLVELIPKKTPEIGGSGGSGGVIIVKLSRKAIKTGVCTQIGVCWQRGWDAGRCGRSSSFPTMEG